MGDKMNTLKFAIGDGDKPGLGIIRNTLQTNGHIIACEETDGPSLLRKIRSMRPDFVIVGYGIPGMKGLEIARIVQGDRIAPVLLTIESSQNIFIREVGGEHFPYLIKPISPAQLIGTVDFTYLSYKKLVDLENEVLKLKTTLETRKAVEIAKGILIDRYNMKEQDAFRYIQKKSMDECRPILEIAKRIIEKSNKDI